MSKDKTRRVRIALVGNPNTGKTTLFNRLTGARQKIGNYPGVTVEKNPVHGKAADAPSPSSTSPALIALQHLRPMNAWRSISWPVTSTAKKNRTP